MKYDRASMNADRAQTGLPLRTVAEVDLMNDYLKFKKLDLAMAFYRGTRIDTSVARLLREYTKDELVEWCAVSYPFSPVVKYPQGTNYLDLPKSEFKKVAEPAIAPEKNLWQLFFDRSYS